MTGLEWAGVAALGGAGAVLRYLVDSVIERGSSRELPVGTLVINVVGAFALGLATGTGLGGSSLLLVGAGLLGSFTTFSTWMLETHRLAEDGELGVAALNLGLGLAAGLAAGGCGWALGALL